MEERKETAKKIGIFGGSFDPIHRGHLAIAEAAYREFGLDEVWFIPAGHSPNKDERGMTSPELRAEMVSLAIEPYPYFKLSRMEIEASGTSYTYLTLSRLKEQYPENTFYFIMGADSLDYFEDWCHPEIICEKAVVLVAVREQWNRQLVEEKIEQIKAMFQAQIYALSCPRFDAASREIRQAIREQHNVEALLPDNVVEFIQKHELYTNLYVSDKK